MTNTTQIRAYIESQGLKLGHVARVLGISSSALHQKLNDESDFKVSEADRLSAMLGLTMEQRDACFFGPGTRMCQRKGAGVMTAEQRRKTREALQNYGTRQWARSPANWGWTGPSSRRRSITAPPTPSVQACSSCATWSAARRRMCWSGSASDAPPTRKPSSIC